MNDQDAQHQVLLLQGEVQQLNNQLQNAQAQLQAQQDPAAVFQQHLAQDRQLKEREWRRKLIREEVAKVTKCDGAEPEAVRNWVKEIDLVHTPDQRAYKEVVFATVVGPFRRELERYISTLAGNRLDIPWNNIKAHMTAAFVSTDNLELTKRKLEKIKQEPYETIVSYNRRFREIAEEAYPLAHRNADQERALIKAYAKGLAIDAHARKLVAQGWPADLDDALERMAQLATASEIYDHLGRQIERMEVGQISTPQPPIEIQRLSTNVAKMQNQLSQMQQRLPDNAPNRSKFQGNCYNCGKSGHMSRDCRAPRRNNYSRPSNNNFRSSRNNYRSPPNNYRSAPNDDRGYSQPREPKN